MTLTGTFGTTLALKVAKAFELSDGTVPVADSENVKVWTITSGTGLDKANLIFVDQRTVAASTNDDLDLIGGGLLDPFGDALAFVQLKGIYIRAALAKPSTITIGNVTNAVPVFGAATHSLPLQPDGVLQIVMPSATAITVAAGTGDILRITNDSGAATMTYDIVLVGADA